MGANLSWPLLISAIYVYLCACGLQDILVKNSQFARLLKQLEDVTNNTSAVENEVAGVELRTKDMVSSQHILQHRKQYVVPALHK